MEHTKIFLNSSSICGHSMIKILQSINKSKSCNILKPVIFLLISKSHCFWDSPYYDVPTYLLFFSNRQKAPGVGVCGGLLHIMCLCWTPHGQTHTRRRVAIICSRRWRSNSRFCFRRGALGR